jgi:sulfoacetaldehyde dehydrogenase
MGCGSWGGNSIDENLHWKHFLNTTRVVREIKPNEPSPDDVFAAYWAKAGSSGSQRG